MEESSPDKWWRDPRDSRHTPYEVLQATPTASLRELQRQRTLLLAMPDTRPGEVSKAWKECSEMSRRLVLDAFFYFMPDTGGEGDRKEGA